MNFLPHHNRVAKSQRHTDDSKKNAPVQPAATTRSSGGVLLTTRRNQISPDPTEQARSAWTATAATPRAPLPGGSRSGTTGTISSAAGKPTAAICNKTEAFTAEFNIPVPKDKEVKALPTGCEDEGIRQKKQKEVRAMACF